MSAVVLMVAEKPSIAGSIASVLSGGGHDTRGGKLPVYEFPGSFQGRQVVFRVTSVTGHVYSTDFPSEYSSWDSCEPVDLFQAKTIKKVSAWVDTKEGETSYL